MISYKYYINGGFNMVVTVKNNEYNLNSVYIRKLIQQKNIKKTDLMKLFNKSQAAVYARLSGAKIMTIEEGFKLAQLLNINIYTLFAPTQQEIIDVLCNDKVI